MKSQPPFDPKKNHILFTEIGLILSLLFLIAATNIEIKSDRKPVAVEIPDIDFIPVDLPPEIPPEKPAPHKPSVIVEAPDHEMIDDDMPEFAEFTDAFDKKISPPEPDVKEDEEIVHFLPVMPTIIGGHKALYSKIKYPQVAQNTGTEGRVDVEFIIDKEGNVTNPKIVRSVHPLLDEEVLRVIRLVKFSPGVQNGSLVKVRMVQPVYFKLNR